MCSLMNRTSSRYGQTSRIHFRLLSRSYITSIFHSLSTCLRHLYGCTISSENCIILNNYSRENIRLYPCMILKVPWYCFLSISLTLHTYSPFFRSAFHLFNKYSVAILSHNWAAACAFCLSKLSLLLSRLLYHDTLHHYVLAYIYICTML